MSLSKERIEEFKAIFKKEYGKELSDQEAYESATNLMNFAEVLYECAKKDYLRKQQLKKEPEGFHMTDGIYTLWEVCQVFSPGWTMLEPVLWKGKTRLF